MKPATEQQIRQAAEHLKIFCQADDTSLYVTGPIIVHEHNGYGLEANPMKTNKLFKQQIFAERIDIGMGLGRFLVGPTEWMCVAYGRAVGDYCPYPDFIDVWIWAAGTAMAAISAPCTLDSMYRGLKGSGRTDANRLTRDDVLTNPRFRSVYNGLATEVRAKVSKHQAKEALTLKRLKAKERDASLTETQELLEADE